MSQAPTPPPPPNGVPPPATPSAIPTPAITAPNVTKKAASQGNPAFRAMGLPNWTPKLPSRNWLIFWTIVGSWTGALIYDRQQTKKTKQKWCTLVSHIASEPLPTNVLPRKMTIFLTAPPADSLSSSREHFVEYVKPVLVAAAMDWDVVEGRREGDVRAALAERIRRYRNRAGERVEVAFEETATSVLVPLRERIGVRECEGEKGDIVVGRNAWKEYVRGLHEGWLGPMDAPAEPAEPAAAVSKTVVQEDTTPLPAQGDAASTIEPEETTITKEKKEDETIPPPPEPPAKPLVPLPHNTPESYPSSSLPASIPDHLGPSIAIPFPHILGFFNTPIRMYRFLNRRALADDIGRRTAAAVLAHHRQYQHSSSSSKESSFEASNHPTSSTESSSSEISTASSSSSWEQQSLLLHEEREWHKSVKNAKEYAPERVWLDEPVIDARIGERMRKFEIIATDEERARAIRRGAAGLPGRVGEEGEEKGL